MTIAAIATSVQYVRNGTTTQWSFPNKIFAAADLVVTDLDTSVPPVQTPLVLGTDYTVQNVDVDTGCTVITTVAGVNGHTLDVRTNIAELQTTSIKNQGAFFPELHEEAFDKLTREVQDLKRLAYTFGIHGPDIESVTWPALPIAAARRNNALMFDAISGLPVLGVPNTQTITTGLLAPFLNLQQTPAEIAAGVTPTNLGYAQFNVNRYGADPTGVADSTAAFAAAYAVARQYTLGATVYAPRGTYSVSSLNWSSAAAQFTASINLRGDGRFATSIVPNAAGNILLNLVGTNQGQFSDFTLGSPTSGFTSQCGICLARTVGSQNCAYNKFTNVYVEGPFSVAGVVSIAAESMVWTNCRIANTSPTNNYCGLWTGGGTGAVAAAIALGLVVPVYTLFDSSNTSNDMFGCEIYCPFNGATPWIFYQMAGWALFGCYTITGVTNNCKIATYQTVPGTNVFQGPVSWFNPHMETNGSSNIIHYLKGNGTQSIFIGINSYGGYYELTSNSAFLDYDRTTIAEQPVLVSSTWTNPQVPNNATGLNWYCWSLYTCNIVFKPSLNNGVVQCTGFIQESSVDSTTFVGGPTRFVNCTHQSVAVSIPTTGMYTLGEQIYIETPLIGLPQRYRCTASGMLQTLAGVTGSIGANSNVLTVNTLVGLTEGAYINIAGAVGGPFSITKIIGVATVYLQTNNVGGVLAGAAVSFAVGVLTPEFNLQNAVAGFGVPVGNAVIAAYNSGTSTALQDKQTIAEILVVLKSAGLMAT